MVAAAVGAATRSAFVGAVVMQVASFGGFWLQPSSFATAAWGWQMTGDPAAGFTCSPQTVGCTATGPCTEQDLTCDVEPEPGYTCNVQQTQVMCQQSVQGSEPFSPPSIHGSKGCKTKAGKATLFFSPAVSCTATKQPEQQQKPVKKQAKQQQKPDKDQKKQDTKQAKQQQKPDKEQKKQEKKQEKQQKKQEKKEKKEKKKKGLFVQSDAESNHTTESMEADIKSVEIHPYVETDAVHFMQDSEDRADSDGEL